MILQAIGRNGLLLGVFAAVATLALAGTWVATRDTIEEQQRIAEARLLSEVLPADEHDNLLLDDTVMLQNASELGVEPGGVAYRGRQQGEVVAVILPTVAPDGYSGQIELIVGIRADGSVLGVRTVKHKETPGLGDAIDARKSHWILNFTDRSLSNPSTEGWAVKKDGGVFDQFTGATITPRAVVASVQRALVYFKTHRSALLDLKQESPQHG